MAPKPGDGPPTGGAGAGNKANGNDAQAAGQKRKREKRGGQKDLRFQAMHQAAKHNNFKAGMAVFREVTGEGVDVPTSLINTLMYVACGGEQWERFVRGLPLLTAEEAAAAAAAADGSAPAGDAAGREGSQQQAQDQAAAAAAAGGGGAGKAEGGAAEQQQQQQQDLEDGEERPAKRRPHVGKPEGPPPTKEELVAGMDELWAYMQREGLAADQGTYLALARREALRGDPRAALQWARECMAKKLPVQLRLFQPAMVGFCLTSDLPALLEVDQLIAANKLDCTEYEYARLLEGIAAAGTYQQLRGVLLRVQSDLNELSPATAQHIAAFFEGPRDAAQQAFAPADQGGCPGLAAAGATAAGASIGTGTAEAAQEQAGTEGAAGGDGGAGGRWRVERGVAVEAGGRCEAAGGSLRVIDLEDQEWDTFAEAIAGLARSNMTHRAGDFDAYAAWYDRNGPYDILVDGANVAFFGQNHEGGGFQWAQIRHMYDMLRERYPDKKILVMLHKKRISSPEARHPDVVAFLERLKSRKSFYYTPPGANDDWFWLYACVRAKQQGLLVSNDELRDHIFSLLRPRHFLKWKERHIAHYEFSPAALAIGPGGAAAYRLPPGQLFELRLPRPYTACVQQVPESGAWMLPLTDGSWVCVRPERVAAA